MAIKKETVERPISISKKDRKRLLEPGYWGYLEEEEVEFIQAMLQENPDLSYAWGFHPVQKNSIPCYDPPGSYVCEPYKPRGKY